MGHISQLLTLFTASSTVHSSETQSFAADSFLTCRTSKILVCTQHHARVGKIEHTRSDQARTPKLLFSAESSRIVPGKQTPRLQHAQRRAQKPLMAQHWSQCPAVGSRVQSPISDKGCLASEVTRSGCLLILKRTLCQLTMLLRAARGRMRAIC